jgi:hypothetical protein
VGESNSGDLETSTTSTTSTTEMPMRKDEENSEFVTRLDSNGRPRQYLNYKQYRKNLEPKTDDEGRRLKPNMHWCKKCQVWQPYRTKHCNLCECCIGKFDHHCFWVGGCVGELNHGKFWLMLLMFTLEFSQVFYYVVTGCILNHEGYEEKHGLPSGTYTKEYGAMFVSALIVGLFWIFVVNFLGVLKK